MADKLTNWQNKNNKITSCDAKSLGQQTECIHFEWNNDNSRCAFFKDGDYRWCDWTQQGQDNLVAFNKRR